jgi:anti-sigma28 factor (negative regulator of flagellin synthesis)
MDISVSNNGFSVRAPERLDARPQVSPPRVNGSQSTDSVSFSSEGLKIANWIEMAKAEPAVRSEKVAEFKDRVQSGNYPPPAVAEGLARLIGTGILSQTPS